MLKTLWKFFRILSDSITAWHGEIPTFKPISCQSYEKKTDFLEDITNQIMQEYLKEASNSKRYKKFFSVNKSLAQKKFQLKKWHKQEAKRQKAKNFFNQIFAIIFLIYCFLFITNIISILL